MTGRIGWYVHHHGRGHLTRLSAVAPHVDADIVCFSSLPEPAELPANCRWTVLERDDGDVDGKPASSREPTADALLHWAPLGHPGHRARLAAIAAHVAAEPVDAFVVDVSVEVTLLVRLLGIPPIVFTQPGTRDDDPHRLAFRTAAAIVAPWPGELSRPAHLAPFAAKTAFTGGISRFDARPATSGRTSGVLVLTGAGGSATTTRDAERASHATGRPWRRVDDPVWDPDPWDRLVGADVVVSEAGQNAVADLAAAEARAVVIPQPRPFAEQEATGRVLERAGLAVVVPRWASPQEWPAVLERAEALRPDWSRWAVSGAAERAAAAIHGVAR